MTQGLGLGRHPILVIVEKQVEKSMDDEMESGCIETLIGVMQCVGLKYLPIFSFNILCTSSPYNSVKQCPCSPRHSPLSTGKVLTLKPTLPINWVGP